MPDHTKPVGILLTNLGSPAAPTPHAVRRYLKEFLWDARVVDLPRPLWWLLLNAVILNTRPRKTAKKYAGIWTEEGSPLLAETMRQKQLLENSLQKRFGKNIQVALAMRYGHPSIRRGLEHLFEWGCRRVLVLPLYPQYSATTTASVFDTVAEVLTAWRDLPELGFVRDYHDHPAYIHALAASVRELWERDGKPERLLMSFHGIPKRYWESGDPYPEQCRQTAQLLAAALGLHDNQWGLSFQSRFGREEWVRPYTDETLVQWAADGVKHTDVICPGFAADCLETQEEIAVEGRQLFEKAGGERLRYIPALDSRPDHIEALAALVEMQCGGWLAG